MSEETASIFEKMVLELYKALLPLTDINSKEKATMLFKKLGYKLGATEEISAAINAAADIISELPQKAAEIYEAEDTTQRMVKVAALVSDITKSVEKIMDLKSSLENSYAQISSNSNLVSAIAQELPKRLLDYLLCTYLASRQRRVFAVLNLIGLTSSIEVNFVSLTGENEDEKVNISCISWKYITKLVSDPLYVVEKEYNWKKDGDIRLEVFLERLTGIMRSYLLPGGLYPQKKNVSDLLAKAPVNTPVKELRMPLYQGGEWPDTYGEVGMSVAPVMKGDKVDGMSIMPYLFGSAQASVDISETLQLQAFVKGGFDNGLALILRPVCEVEFITDLFTNPLDSTDCEFKLSIRQQEEAPQEIILLGYEESTRLSVSKLGMTLFGSKADEVQDFGIEFNLGEIKLVVTADDGDAFVQKILSQPIEISCGIQMGFSSSRGFYLKAGVGSGAGLDFVLQVNKSIGPVLIDNIHFQLKFNDQKISLITAVSGGAVMGPLSVSIMDIGLETAVEIEKSGLLGDADLWFGFKPPDGFGLAIKASVVKGGGFLLIDRERGRYFGALQLQFKTIALAAIGLLDTKDAEGKTLEGGFSLLIIICAEIPPIQLGYGFSLCGIGGLLGLNRTVAVDELSDGIRNGGLDSIMFPPDPVGNAAKIVQTLSTVFPPAKDRFLIAPMVRIGWGTPQPILKLDLSILIELPTFDKIVILGRMKLVLPDEASPVVCIHLDSVGILSLEQGSVLIDAVLYDSFIAKIMISGQMAFRACWKGNPDFVLSIGGFHPAYTPPASFPDLERLALSLDIGDNARVRMESYMALATNSVQFGARVDLYAEVACFSAAGLLSFDTLMYFEPFGLMVDFVGAVAIKCSGAAICAVSLEAHLKGPNPWHVWGKAKFTFLGISREFHLDLKIGPAEPPKLPLPVNVEAILAEEISHLQNWAAQPPAGLSVVSLREIMPVEGEIRVHPLGGLKFVQTRVPFNITLAKFGHAFVEGNNSFKITGITLEDDTKPQAYKTIKAAFAPAQFLELTELEKLTCPPFEYFDCGMEIEFDKVDIDDQYDSAEFGYETILVDDEDIRPAAKLELTSAEIAASVLTGPAGQSPLRKAAGFYFKEPQFEIATKQPKFGVIDEAVLKKPLVFETFAEAAQIKRGAAGLKKKTRILTVLEW